MPVTLFLVGGSGTFAGGIVFDDSDAIAGDVGFEHVVDVSVAFITDTNLIGSGGTSTHAHHGVSVVESNGFMEARSVSLGSGFARKHGRIQNGDVPPPCVPIMIRNNPTICTYRVLISKID